MLSLVKSLSPARLVCGCWLAAGMACIPLDEITQPYLTELGRQPWPRCLAERWQDLGATYGILLFLLVGLATWRVDRGRTFIQFAICVSAVGAAAQVVKHVVGRVRPHAAGDSTLFLGPLGIFNSGPNVPIDSMPSGHTAAAFAMATVLALRWPSTRWAVFPLAIGVGISRTLVDRHFPSDVVLGSLLGTTLAVAAWNWSANLCRGPCTGTELTDEVS